MTLHYLLECDLDAAVVTGRHMVLIGFLSHAQNAKIDGQTPVPTSVARKGWVFDENESHCISKSHSIKHCAHGAVHKKT